MTNEEFWNDLRELVNSKPWKTLCQELENNSRALNDISSMKTEEELFHRKGQLAAYGYLLNLHLQVEQMDNADNS